MYYYYYYYYYYYFFFSISIFTIHFVALEKGSKNMDRSPFSVIRWSPDLLERCFGLAILGVCHEVPKHSFTAGEGGSRLANWMVKIMVPNPIF